MKSVFTHWCFKTKNAGKWIVLFTVNSIPSFISTVKRFLSFCVCRYFNRFVIMSASFHCIFKCFCNVSGVITTFWNLYFKPFSLLWRWWQVVIVSPCFKKSTWISKSICLENCYRSQVHQSNFIFSVFIQLDWRFKSRLYFCWIVWNNNLSWRFWRSVSLNFYDVIIKFCTHSIILQ